MKYLLSLLAIVVALHSVAQQTRLKALSISKYSGSAFALTDTLVHVYNTGNYTDIADSIYSFTVSGSIPVVSYRMYNQPLGGKSYSNTKQDWNASQSTFVNAYKRDYYYDAAGKYVKMVFANWNAGTSSWVPYFYDTVQYNAAGAETTRINHNYDIASQSWKKELRNRTVYNSNGLIDSTILEYFVNNTWRDTGHVVHLYYAPLKAALVQTNKTGLIWDTTRRDYYEYNAAKLLVVDSSETEAIVPGQWEPWTTMHRKYDAAGNKLLDSMRLYTTNPGLPWFKNNYTYNSNNQMTRDLKHGEWDVASSGWVHKQNDADWRMYYEVFNDVANVPAPVAHMELYPNPASGALTVMVGLPKNEPVVLRVISLTGRHLQVVPLSGQKQHIQQLDLSSLPGGQYMLTVEGNGWSRTERFVVEH